MKQKTRQVSVLYKKQGKINNDVIEEIGRIEQEEELTAEAVLENARDKHNVLHGFFDWNDEIAGEKWRLHQARMLINEIKIVIDSKEYSAYENVSVSIEGDGKERVYKPILDIISNEKLRQQIISRAMEKQKYWKQQYGVYEELKPIIVSIESVERDLQGRWQKRKKR
jgi:hypothetical protein